MDTRWLDSHKWDRNIAAPLSAPDHQRFQADLDAIVGVEPDGTKRWRLVWGGDVDRTMLWDRFRAEWRPRYAWDKDKKWRTLESGFRVQYHVWICIPRYFIECLVPDSARDLEAEQAGVIKTAVGRPDGTVEEVVTETFTERRLYDGRDYMLLTPIYEHSQVITQGWRSCCLKAIKAKSKCFGRFRLPDQKDLDHLAENWAERVAEHGKPGALTEEDRALIFAELAAEKARQKAEQQERDVELREFIKQRVRWEKLNGHNLGSLKRSISLPE